MDLRQISHETGIALTTLHYRKQHGIPLTKPPITTYKADGDEMTLAEWAEELEMDKKTLYDRIRYISKSRDISPDEALEHFIETEFE